MSKLIRFVLKKYSLALVLIVFPLALPFEATATIASTSGNVLYVDSSSNQSPKLLGNYVGYNVTNNTGADRRCLGHDREFHRGLRVAGAERNRYCPHRSDGRRDDQSGLLLSSS